MNKESLITDFSPFSDIGSDAPKITGQKGKFTIAFLRNAKQLKLVLDVESGQVVAKWGALAERTYTSIAALLASEIFANLKRWAEIQADEVRKKNRNAGPAIIPFNIKNHDGVELAGLGDVALCVNSPVKPNSVKVLVVDGPAGIGKTFLIRSLARLRAENYLNKSKVQSEPLILHVESRGRVLSNLTDLMAFSLQAIRVPVMYDQVPVLVRYGLVAVAIDGFDELGDPNGYDMAWAQLSEFISTVRGCGVLILAGRDTFLNRERVLRNVSALREGVDEIGSVTLDVPSPADAMTWLQTRPQTKWSDASFKTLAIAALFEKGSFALRPVFLTLLAEKITPKYIKENSQRPLTALLLDGLIDRESRLFGKSVDAVLNQAQLRDYLNKFLIEVAREMADSQTESLDAVTIAWISEYSLGGNYPSDIVGTIKNRALVVAPLIVDERPDYRAFVHSHVQNYYLSRATVESLAQGELPKYIRRNIFGQEFLKVFADVIPDYQKDGNRELLQKFLVHANITAQQQINMDRASRNLGALLFSALPEIQLEDKAHFSGFQIDDAVARGTAGPVKFSSVAINQLDCRQADLSKVGFFDGCSITSVIADDGTRFSETFPTPVNLIDGQHENISDATRIGRWINERGRALRTGSSIVSDRLRGHAIYALLGQACRTRRYWIRAGGDDVLADRILNNEHWPALLGVLSEYGFLRTDSRQASGKFAHFYHIRHPERILAENCADIELANFFRDLEGKI